MKMFAPKITKMNTDAEVSRWEDLEKMRHYFRRVKLANNERR